MTREDGGLLKKWGALTLAGKWSESLTCFHFPTHWLNAEASRDLPRREQSNEVWGDWVLHGHVKPRPCLPTWSVMQTRGSIVLY